MNNQLLVQAEKWLNDLGIQTNPQNNSLGVSRDAVSVLLGSTVNGQEYNEILEEMKTALNTKKIFWGSKDDNWLWLESF